MKMFLGRSTSVSAYVIFCCFGIFASSAMAQVSSPAAAGSSRTSSRYDPLKQVVGPRVPDTPSSMTVIQHPPPIPLAEYQLRKSTITPRIETPGPRGPQIVQAGGSQTVTPRQPVVSTPTIGFEGIFQQLYQPPSSNMAAGPEDLIQIINSAIGRFTKTGTKTDDKGLPTWFADLLPVVCSSGLGNCLIADPSIRYDQMHGRFILTAQARNFFARTSYFVISISNGATYASGWKNWALDASLDGTTASGNWADFPQVGFDNSGVYISTLMFSWTTNSFVYSKVRILKKSELYDPATTVLTWQDLVNLKHEDNTLASTLQPVHVRGRVGVGPPGAYLVSASDVSLANYYTLFKINNPTSATPTVTRTTIKSVWPYSYPASAPQLGSSLLIDTGQSSILKAIYREGIIYTAQNAKLAEEPTTVVYGRIDAATSKITSQSKWVNGNFFFPAFDVPASTGPGNVFPDTLVVGTTTDSLGQLTFPGLRNSKAGEDSFDVFTGNPTRWGDYFGGAVDPVNGGLWTFGEYSKKKDAGGISAYGTWASYFPWSTAAQFEDVPSTDPSFHFINVLSQWGVTKGCSTIPARYCPEATVTREQMAVFIVRSIYGDTFDYNPIAYFTDVPSSAPFFTYIQKLRDLGITSGCTTTTFCPGRAITRGEVAVFVVRAKLKALQGDTFSFPSTAYFTDVPATDVWFSFIQKLRELGITAGCTASEFCRDRSLTRGEMSVFLTRGFLN